MIEYRKCPKATLRGGGWGRDYDVVELSRWDIGHVEEGVGDVREQVLCYIIPLECLTSGKKVNS